MVKTTVEKSKINALIPQYISGIEQAMKTKSRSILSLVCLLAFTSFITGCDGEATTSEPSNRVRMSGGLAYGKQTGELFTGIGVIKYGDGSRQEATFKNGKRHGKMYEWDSNGEKRKEATFIHGEEEKIVGWYKNGQMEFESNYLDGKRSGRQVRWYKNGQMEYESNYIDDIENGRQTSWYQNGQLKEISNYKFGMPDEMVTKWREDGEKSSEISYKFGKRHGLSISWHTNGKKFSEGSYVLGKKHGLHTTWYWGGHKCSETTYKNDVIHGKFIMWDDENPGRKWFEKTYVNGELVPTTYENGVKK